VKSISEQAGQFASFSAQQFDDVFFSSCLSTERLTLRVSCPRGAEASARSRSALGLRSGSSGGCARLIGLCTRGHETRSVNLSVLKQELKNVIELLS